MALATLSIDLVAKLASLEEGFSKATRLAEKNAAAMEARYAKIGGAVRAVAGVVGTAFAGVSFIGLIKGTVDSLDALNDLRDATGASIENLSALEDTAARTGTSYESMASTLVKFNKVLSDSEKPGNVAAQAIGALGLKVAELKKLDPAEALRQTAVALSQYADDGNKARIVQELFGKSVQEAAPFLNDLAKQAKLVGTVTSEQAEEAEKFNQQLSQLSKNATDATRSLVSSLVPAINQFFDAIKRNKQGGGFFSSIFEEIKANLASDRLRVVTAEIESIQKAIDRQGATPLLTKKLAGLREEAKRLIKDASDASEALKKFAPANLSDYSNEGRSAPKPSLQLPNATPDKSKKAAQDISEAQRALAQYVSQQERELKVTQDLSEEQEALNFLKGLGTLGEVPQVRALVLGLAAQNDQLRDQAALTKLANEAEKDRARQREEAQRGLSALLEQTPTAQYEKLVDLSAQLDDAFAKGQVTGQKYAEALRGIDTALKAVEPEAKKAEEATKTFAEQAARNIQDSLGDTVLATLKGDFDSIGRLWGNLIQKMISEALAAKLGEALLGNFAQTGKIGGGLGSLLSIFGFHSGGVAGRDGTPYRYHSGGVAGLKPDEVPAVLQVGEEVITRSDPRHRDNRSSSGTTIINNVQAGVTRNEMLAALSAAMQSMRGEFKQTLRLAGVA